jgi:hypothetical protein
VVNGRGYQTFDIYHKIECKRLCLSASSANSILLGRVYVLGNVPQSDFHKSLRGLLSSRIQFLPCRGNEGMEVKSLFCIVSPILGRTLQTLLLAFLLRRHLLVRSHPSRYLVIGVIHELLTLMGFIFSSVVTWGVLNLDLLVDCFFRRG